MKKAILGLIAVCLLVVLSACDTGSAPEPEAVYDGTGDHHYYMMDRASDTATLNVSSSGTSERLEAQVVGDLLTVGGDMVLAKASDGLSPEATIQRGRLWPDNTVYYTMRSDLSQRARDAVLRAAEFYNENTNIRVVPRTSQRGYVEFIPSDGCWSYVGYQGRRQEIGLAAGCGFAAALHEIGHAIGFQHEQSAPERDRFIRIDCNIINCNDGNWAKARRAELFQGKYDYYSIMHYGAFRGGRQVIFPLQDGVDPRRIGRSGRLTAQDIAAVNSLYPGSNPNPPAPNPDPPTPDPTNPNPPDPDPTNPPPPDPGRNVGTYRVQIGNNCLDVYKASETRGTKFQMWGCWGGANQTFEIKRFGRTYTLTAKHSGMNLDVSRVSKAPGAILHQWPVHNRDNQQFRITRSGRGLQIRAQHSGLCLDAGNNTNGVTITQQRCDGSAGQQFRFSRLD